MEADAIKAELLKRRKAAPLSNKDILSTGSTLVNLACTGKPHGGLVKGHYHLFVGDSNSGKTWMLMNTFAEAAVNPHFKGYRLIFDNAEDGALMDVQAFFGAAVAKRLEPPAKDKGPVFSSTVEEFYDHLDAAIKDGRPFVYGLDSMDALSSETEQDKAQEQRTARYKGKAITGSYGDGKAKKNSAGIRQILHCLKETGSILIIVSQTRDNIGFGAQFNPKTMSGGHALSFYASTRLWFSVKQRLSKCVKGKDRQVGVLSQVHVKRTRVTGREHKVDIPIYTSYGIDDVGSCIDYLVMEGYWKEGKDGIDAKDFGFKGSRDKLITKIEAEDLEVELRLVTARCWNEIEDACALKRKMRYD